MKADKGVPKVSIILPVYNVENWIKQSIDSILSQTLTNWEAIFVIDGSTDASLEIIRNFAAKDERCNLIIQPNQGQGAARNNGVSAAKGKYLLFLDPDDLLSTNALQVLVSAAEGADADVVFGDFVEFLDESDYEISTGKASANFFITFVNLKSPFNPSHITDNPNFYRSIYFSALWGKLYRREKWVDLGIIAPTGITMAEDFLPLKKMIFGSERISLSPNIVYHYRKRSGSATTKRTKAALSIIKVYGLVVHEYEEMALSENDKRLMHENFIFLFWYHMIHYSPVRFHYIFARQIRKTFNITPLHILNRFENPHARKHVSKLKNGKFALNIRTLVYFYSIDETMEPSSRRLFKSIYRILPWVIRHKYIRPTYFFIRTKVSRLARWH